MTQKFHHHSSEDIRALTRFLSPKDNLINYYWKHLNIKVDPFDFFASHCLASRSKIHEFLTLCVERD